MSEPTASARAYAALPSWRKPYGESIATPEERRARELGSMRAAILDIVGAAALTRDQISRGLREDWGACSDASIGHALRVLMRDCQLRRYGDFYVGVDP